MISSFSWAIATLLAVLAHFASAQPSRQPALDGASVTDTCTMVVYNAGGGVWGIGCVGGCDTEACDDWTNPQTHFVTCLCGFASPDTPCRSAFNPDTGAIKCKPGTCSTGQCDSLPLPPVGQEGSICRCDGN